MAQPFSRLDAWRSLRGKYYSQSESFDSAGSRYIGADILCDRGSSWGIYFVLPFGAEV